MIARLLTGGMLFLWAGVGAASAEPEGVPSIWKAADRLGITGYGVGASGVWVECEAITREAVSEEWESGVAFGYESPGSPGGGIGWRRSWSPLEPSTDALLAFAGHRRWGGRWGGGWGTTRRGSHRTSHATLGAAYPVSRGFLVGTDAWIFSAATPGAPEIRFWCVAERGAGMAGVRLGPQPENYLLSLAVRLDSRLIWSAAISDLAPSLGISWRLGAVELMVRSSRHPFLGSVTRFRIQWMGRR